MNDDMKHFFEANLPGGLPIYTQVPREARLPYAVLQMGPIQFDNGLEGASHRQKTKGTLTLWASRKTSEIIPMVEHRWMKMDAQGETSDHTFALTKGGLLLEVIQSKFGEELLKLSAPFSLKMKGKNHASH